MKILCSKICPTGKTSYIYENGNEARDVFGDPRLVTHVGRVKKIRSAPRTNQNAGFVTVLSGRKKKINNNKRLNFVSISLKIINK